MSSPTVDIFSFIVAFPLDNQKTFFPLFSFDHRHPFVHPHPLPLATAFLFSGPMNSVSLFSGSTYKRERSVFVLLCHWA